jgi:3-(3-hydroxy-phenyl)propionate hydroxylase
LRAVSLGPDGSQGVVNDLIEWADGRLLVLVFGDMSQAAARRLRDISAAAPVYAVQVLGPDTHPQAREHVIDPQGHLQGACHVFGHAWALVRPDAYIAATGESVDAGLILAIEQAMGLKSEER